MKYVNVVGKIFLILVLNLTRNGNDVESSTNHKRICIAFSCGCFHTISNCTSTLKMACIQKIEMNNVVNENDNINNQSRLFNILKIKK